MVGQAEPDLVLLDIRMPELNGLEAARSILDVRPVPIVIVTGHTDQSLIDDAAELGVFSYLVKPLTRERLAAAIATARSIPAGAVTKTTSCRPHTSRASSGVAVGGTVVLYSAFEDDVPATVGADRSHREEVAIVGAYSQEPEDWTVASSLIRSGVIADDLDALVTAKYDFASAAEALTLVTSEPTFRVYIEPSDPHD